MDGLVMRTARTPGASVTSSTLQFGFVIATKITKIHEDYSFVCLRVLRG
jgi:hypothetical protein